MKFFQFDLFHCKILREDIKIKKQQKEGKWYHWGREGQNNH